jgi:hypothetical protein
MPCRLKSHAENPAQPGGKGGALTAGKHAGVIRVEEAAGIFRWR